MSVSTHVGFNCARRFPFVLDFSGSGRPFVPSSEETSVNRSVVEPVLGRSWCATVDVVDPAVALEGSVLSLSGAFVGMEDGLPGSSAKTARANWSILPFGRPGRSRLIPGVSFQSLALAVGQIRIASTSVVPVCMIPVFVVCRAASLESPTVAVGQTLDAVLGAAVARVAPSRLASGRGIVGDSEDEDPLASVRCADFLRRKQSERAAETAFRQVPKDAIESEREVSGDVFEEDASRSKSPDEVEDDRPEMTRVVFSQSFPGGGEGLARIAAGDPVDRR